MKLTLTIHHVGSGTCSLTDKEGDGLAVTFEDGTVKEAFLSHKMFLKLVRMKFGQAQRSEPKPMTTPDNGVVLAPIVK